MSGPQGSWGGSPREPIGPAPGLVYATFGARLIAFVIDAIVVGVIGAAISAAFGLGLVPWYGFDVRDATWWRFGMMPFGIGGVLGSAWLIAYAVVQAAVSGFYFVYSWRTWSASPGQRILDLEVRNAADGALLGGDQAIRRWVFLIVPIVGALPVLGAIVALYHLFLAYTTYTDPYRQGWHDKQVGTVVVRRVA